MNIYVKNDPDHPVWLHNHYLAPVGPQDFQSLLGLRISNRTLLLALGQALGTELFGVTRKRALSARLYRASSSSMKNYILNTDDRLLLGGQNLSASRVPIHTYIYIYAHNARHHSNLVCKFVSVT